MFASSKPFTQLSAFYVHVLFSNIPDFSGEGLKVVGLGSIFKSLYRKLHFKIHTQRISCLGGREELFHGYANFFYDQIQSQSY